MILYYERLTHFIYMFDLLKYLHFTIAIFICSTAQLKTCSMFDLLQYLNFIIALFFYIYFRHIHLLGKYNK